MHVDTREDFQNDDPQNASARMLTEASFNFSFNLSEASVRERASGQ